jgi:DNA-binding transcriptional regulator YbjK
MSEIKVVRHWDSMPPVLHDQGQAYSTRVLERKYRMMEDALNAIVNNGLDAVQCRDLAASTLAEVRK